MQKRENIIIMRNILEFDIRKIFPSPFLIVGRKNPVRQSDNHFRENIFAVKLRLFFLNYPDILHATDN